MAKRRRASSAASRGQDDDGQEVDYTPEPVTRKRKKYDPAEICQQLYETVRNYKKEDGSLLCDAFIRVPKRRQEPRYYEVVTNPIDLLKIQQKLKTDEYDDVDPLTQDMHLLVNNAKSFYKRSSQEYRDACELWELYNETKLKLTEEGRLDDLTGSAGAGEHKGKIILKVGKLARRAAAAEARKQEMEQEELSETSSSNMEEDWAQYEELFAAVMHATDSDGRTLNPAFQLLPSRRRYPEYYEVIEQPIDLKMIATRIQNQDYQSLTEMERDLLLMTRNACTFNEPGSQIYKDAKALKKIISTKKVEIEHGRTSTPGKSSERIRITPRRNKRLRGGQSLSAVTAALQYEEEDNEDGEDGEEDEEGEGDEEEEGEDDDEEDVEEMEAEEEADGAGGEEVEDADNPRWQLYEAVRSCTNTQGYALSEPFLRLPSKRYYPDYYKEIKNPISLSQIRSKIQRGEYGNISEVAGDMNIMFENAKQYNRPDSRLYKDAVKLQKVMQGKVQDLLEFDQDSESEEDLDEKTGKRKPKPKAVAHGRSKIQESPQRKRYMLLYRTLIDYVHEDGRQPILMFMEKPSKKTYPDYYQIIPEPIDMLTIEANIKNDRYVCEEELIDDFKLMFNNCRQYNEEGSVIYEDATTLEQVIMNKVKELGPSLDGGKKSTKRVKKFPTTLPMKLKALYDAIKDYKDPKGRQLALIFLKLPSKNEYPDYYEVIKKPIDMERILQKLKANVYESLDDLLSDYVLMFDNACKYNEPDSQIYKDALTLQRLALQTKLQLSEDDEAIPDVKAAVQELLTSLFISVYNHQDEEGRCFSDAMAELPEHDEVDGKKVRGVSFDLVKRRLDRGLYKRMDMFQEDMFACFDRARRLSRTDSQVFEDSVELQAFFIRQRDELCRQGELLRTPSLSFTLEHLASTVEALKQEKQQKEQPEDEGDHRTPDDTIKAQAVGGNAISYNQETYHVGDFVYVEPKERGMEPHVICIERLWTNQEGQAMLYGNWFYRPNETYHVSTRKFLEKEVFKSEVHAPTPMNQVLGKCCVMSVKDYFKSKPDSFLDKDVYVCESRYSTKARAFKKIKIWPFSMPSYIQLVPREMAIEPKRIMSVFRERVEKHKEEIAELEEGEKVVEKERPNVEVYNPQGTEGNVYYEQYTLGCGSIKVGDCVYVKAENGRQLVAQVNTIWVTKEGAGYFHASLFVPPTETIHAPTRLFYKQEMFLSTLEDTHALENILARCAVLEQDEYITCRPTEIPEVDCYVCESVYEEGRQDVRKLPRDALKRGPLGPMATPDEVYFFRKPINPQKIENEAASIQLRSKFKVLCEREPSPLLAKMVGDNDLVMGGVSLGVGVGADDSLDGAPGSSLGGSVVGDQLMMSTHTVIVTPTTAGKKVKTPGKKLVTGYILYSSDIRKSVAAKNPESSFGEISRIVGNEWRNLPTLEKQGWEERAAKINEENAAKFIESLPDASSPAASSTGSQGGGGGLGGGGGGGGNAGGNPIGNNPGGINPASELVYDCGWEHCDWQFEDNLDLLDHCVQEASGHVHVSYAGHPETGEFQCMWRGCGRVKKGASPFPNVQRLVRHVREVHIQKGTGKNVPVGERARNFVPSSRRSGQSAGVGQVIAAGAVLGIRCGTPSGAGVVAGVVQQGVQHGGATVQQPVRPPEPIFVSVPPRPQRLLHSEAYIKYIESLQAETRHMSAWDRHLRATVENTPPPDQSRLPSHWLGNGPGSHGTVLNALWALRSFMLKDALGVAKAL